MGLSSTDGPQTCEDRPGAPKGGRTIAAALAIAYAQGATDEAADHGRPPEAVLTEIVGMIVGDMLACTWLSVALLEEPDIASLVQIFGGRPYVRAVLAWRDATREWQISRKWNDRPAPVAPPLPSVP